MLGDVTPSQLRLIQTGTVYTRRDNKFTVTVQKYVGRRYAPVDLSEVTQLLLIIPGPEPVAIDSLTYPDAFSVAGSLLTLDLSDFAFAPGTYTAQLVAFDAEHPRGQVLCETYENELTFTVRDVSATGSIPLPTLSYVEEAPANGVTYGRRDGAWVEVSIDGLDDLIAAVVELQENNAALNAQVLDLQERVTALEQGQPVVPPNALSDASGQILVDSSGETLLLGDVLTSNVLVDTTSTPLVDSGTNELTAGE